MCLRQSGLAFGLAFGDSLCFAPHRRKPRRRGETRSPEADISKMSGHAVAATWSGLEVSGVITCLSFCVSSQLQPSETIAHCRRQDCRINPPACCDIRLDGPESSPQVLAELTVHLPWTSRHPLMKPSYRPRHVDTARLPQFPLHATILANHLTTRQCPTSLPFLCAQARTRTLRQGWRARCGKDTGSDQRRMGRDRRAGGGHRRTLCLGYPMESTDGSR